jgi:DNA-directed RNA polymerase subunit RPC12/RpoP
MMYAIISCGKCDRQRIIDRATTTSKCPYCNNSEDHKKIKIIFEDRDQSVVRDALTNQHSFEKKEKRREADPDPLSTVIYRYEHAKSLQERLELVSYGLTEAFGTFTLEDVEKVDEKNAEKLLNAMLEHCLIHEVKYGRYQA